MLTDRSGRRGLPVVDIVKAVSCIMIFLYHCNTILPGEWKFLTLFGQDLGNNMFFMVSGFSLAPSIDAAPVNRFHLWYLKRLIRILPATALAYLLTYAAGYYSFRDPVQLFAVFIYPTLYWFITAILLFYIILFFIAKFTERKAQLIILLILAAVYMALCFRHERLYFAGLFAMISGYMLREFLSDGSAESKAPSLRRVLLLICAVCLAAFTAGELMIPSHISRALIFAGAAGTGSSALLLGYCLNDSLTAFFEKKSMLHSFIRYVGNMALPLYLVQCFCSGYIGFWIGLHIDFPLSFLVNFLTVWTAGSLLYLMEKLIQKWYNAGKFINSL